ncbi:ADP-ribose pyrophosphatase [Flavobacteriales bacterium]|nr:ADP-ribose pyrophosphatase [Flavobacteriales bacterium]
MKGIFNVRVYAIIINQANEVLLTDEHRFGTSFTKFPGGGLEYGEGLKDGLIREIREELNTEVCSMQHFYTTDFFQPSVFHENQQIISVYYRVNLNNYSHIQTQDEPFCFQQGAKEFAQEFRWKKITEFSPNDVSFPIDKYVANLIVAANTHRL